MNPLELRVDGDTVDKRWKGVMYPLAVEFNLKGHSADVRDIEDDYFRGTISSGLSSTLQKHRWRDVGVNPLDTAVSIGD